MINYTAQKSLQPKQVKDRQHMRILYSLNLATNQIIKKGFSLLLAKTETPSISLVLYSALMILLPV